MNEHPEHNGTMADDFSISRYLRRYGKYRLFFILSLLASLLLAILYIYWKTPLYRIQASLVIKDEKKGEAISLTLKELDFLDEQKIVDNEAEIIRSESNISKVVHSMKLNIGYYERENFLRQQPLFDNSPVELYVINAGKDLYKQALDISIEKNDQFLLKPGGTAHRFGDTITVTGDSRIVVVKKTGSLTNVRVIISDPEETIQQLRGTISAAAPSKNSSVLYISMLYPSREKGAAILKEIIQEYDKANIEEKKAQTDSIVTLIEARLGLIGEQVKNLEGKEDSVKTSQGITFLNDDARSYLDQAKDFDKEYTEAQIQLDNIKKVDEYLASNTNLISPPNSSLNDPVLTNMVTTLNQLEMQKQSLLKKSGPQHPSVLSVSKQVDDLKKSLGDNIRLQRSSLEKRIGLLQKSKGRVNSSISRIPANERHLLELMREKSIRENIYSYLLEKREEAALSDAAVFSKMRLVDEPFSTIKPVKPKKTVVFAAALLIGLLFPIGIISLKENARSKIHTGLLKTKLPYPVIGYIPEMKKFTYTGFREPNSIITEQFRWIRTSLEKTDGKVILVSSPGINDGKSFVSMNLAASFANTRKKTVLIDFDLRKSKMASLLGLQGTTKFSQQLDSGKLNVDELAHRTETNSNLYIIADDSVIENSTALLDHADLPSFFNSLRNNFDYIIINTAPFTYFADAFKLEVFSDVNILVIRDRHTTLQQVSQLKNMIGEDQIKTPSIIYNSIPIKELFEKSQIRGYKNYQYPSYS